LLVAYDGTDFHGFAENVGVVTVGSTLRSAIERVLGADVELTVAGRTDAGVHAWGQVVTFDAPADGLDLDRLQRSINGLCKPAIVVRVAEVAPDDFDARFSAQWRRYRYTVLNRPVPDPFLARTAWLVAEPLDLGAMRLACDPLLGEHDFTSFCRAPRPPAGSPAPSLVRRVVEAGWSDLGDGVLRFEIRANAFCHQMVRSLVGLLVDVGRGRRHAGEVLAVLRARDRGHLGNIAPPTGLCLWEVGYPDGFARA
jgi:tRNA pseudouridine38-40 synthase